MLKITYRWTRHASVRGDSRLAEHLCGLHVTDLTVQRARELADIHRDHLPDDCQIHLAALNLLHH